MLRVALHSKEDADVMILLLPKNGEDGYPDGPEPWFITGTWGNWRFVGMVEVYFRHGGTEERDRKLVAKIHSLDSDVGIVQDLHLEYPKVWEINRLLNVEAPAEKLGKKWPFQVANVEEV